MDKHVYLLRISHFTYISNFFMKKFVFKLFFLKVCNNIFSTKTNRNIHFSETVINMKYKTSIPEERATGDLYISSLSMPYVSYQNEKSTWFSRKLHSHIDEFSNFPQIKLKQHSHFHYLKHTHELHFEISLNNFLKKRF